MKLEGKLCIARRISAHPPKTQHNNIYCNKVALYLSCWHEKQKEFIVVELRKKIVSVEVEKLNTKLRQKPKA